LLEAVKRRVQRSFFDSQDVVRHFLNVSRDPVAVDRATRVKALEDEQIEGALEYAVLGHAQESMPRLLLMQAA
jgi:hypothetical protein